MKKINYIPALLFSALISLPVNVAADTSNQPIEKLISELADKPEQHAAIAKYYKEKAEEAKKAVERHKTMKSSYVSFNNRHPSGFGSMKSHCDKLIKAYETEAEEYEQMAAEHEKLAH